MSVPSLKLNDGCSIPQIGLGLWQIRDEAEFKTSFETAVQAGYRHFDSAQVYDNEHLLGQAWKAGSVPRDQLFLTTKIAAGHFGYHKVKETFQDSLQKLQTDHVDLLLLHFPVTMLRKKAWQALEEIQAAGGAKSIGVSNYTTRHLEEMRHYANVVPAVNQVELHVFLQQPELIQYCQGAGIVVEAYSPLARGLAMEEPAIQGIAARHNKTYAQIMLRWLVEQDLVALPKSTTPSRIRDNIDIFNFQLDSDDRAAIARLESNLHTGRNPAFVP